MVLVNEDGGSSVSLLNNFPRNNIAPIGCVFKIFVVDWNVSALLQMFLEDQVKLSQQWLLQFFQECLKFVRLRLREVVREKDGKGKIECLSSMVGSVNLITLPGEVGADVWS